MKWSISIGAARRPGPRYAGPWHLWCYPQTGKMIDGKAVLNHMDMRYRELPRCTLAEAVGLADAELSALGIEVTEWHPGEDWGSVWYGVGESP